MTITVRMARFAAETPVDPAATAAVASLCEALPAGTEAGRRPADIAARWVACAALYHTNTGGAGRAQAEQGLAVGLELALRMLHSLDGQVVGGWDPVCAAVVVGAATAAARVDGLGSEAITRAIGIAATQASGLAAVSLSPLGTFQHRRAALNGLQAAALARAGMTAPGTALEGRRGLYSLIAPAGDPAGAIERLGERWLVVERPVPPSQVPPDGAPPGADPWSAALTYAMEVFS
ncbi:MmgE/PrpD family protein [Nonomuraea sp. NPDC026600]|uniref:MmgE/PrpD family protein n=1 Tax=Nonomuraea sp. NPDC026600 TaxID=3155363 RepID=UPI00340F5BDC